MPALSTRSILYIALPVLLLLGNGYAFWPFYAASRALQAFCDGVPTGTPLADARQAAQAAGYTLVQGADGGVEVEDPASYGRRRCTLRFDGRGLREAR
jgi:hypothetical protein